MTNKEIKKAWNTMKKEIELELGIKYGFTMTNKQIENRTATYLVCNDFTYEEEIERETNSMNKAIENGNDISYHEENLKELNELKNKYCTKDNQVASMIKVITNSNAFKKFEKVVGKVSCFTEVKYQLGVGYIYIRFVY